MKKKFIFIGKIFGVIIGVLLLCLLSFVLFMGFLFGGFGNKAKDELKPITKEIKRLGGTLLCDNGDGGHGPDNNSPWYQVSYEMSYSSNLTQRITAFVDNQGYNLQTDTEHTNGIKTSDYLIATSNQRTLRIIISRDEKVALQCSDIKYYSKEIVPDPGKVIVKFYLQLP